MEFLYILEGIRTPFLDFLMSTLTHLGEETVFLVLAMILFWCIDKYEGYYLLTVGFIGTELNNFLKVNFRIDRPWVRDPNFKAVESAIEGAGGYSFPSGHTQTSVGNFASLAIWNKNKLVRILSVVLCIVVPFSRMYLGVHTPADVLCSFGIALLLAAGLYPVFKNMQKKSTGFVVVLIILILWSLFQVIYMEVYPFPADADAERIMSGIKNSYKILGAAAGLLISFFVEKKYVRFETKAVWWAQIIKVAAGLGLTLGVKELCYLVFGAVLPSPVDRAFSYFVMVMFAATVWPLTFKYFSRIGKKN